MTTASDRHDATIITTYPHKTLVCCTGSPRALNAVWNPNASPAVAALTPLKPESAYAEVIAHFKDRELTPAETAAVESADTLVALGGDVEQALHSVAQHLPNVTINAL